MVKVKQRAHTVHGREKKKEESIKGRYGKTVTARLWGGWEHHKKVKKRERDGGIGGEKGGSGLVRGETSSGKNVWGTKVFLGLIKRGVTRVGVGD